LLINDIYSGHRLQGSRQVRRRLTTQGLRLDNLHRNSHIRLSLFETSSRNNNIIQDLVVRQHTNVQFGQIGRNDVRFVVISHIGETKLRRLLGIERNGIVSIDITHGTHSGIIPVKNGHSYQRFTRLEIGYNTGNGC